MPRGDLPKCEVADCGRAYLWTCQKCHHRFCGRHDDRHDNKICQDTTHGHDCDDYTEE